ncbi:LacI family DNA-binding transcriptional regulator [Cellulomonas sp. Leaf334]|uniref:LacI family DNA-binding transcriptional regulator n=1 Tax=Cellulomonas sp. Leaf334 TaxID=1736339 RepID=UPI0006F815CC|nr:LacI family DNA-binding transcriptional regulator [Cellulomonas sp. Leaf334]KQR10985.1 LacI family transcriptional regulator [Cellulomonas sp. Leaf334]
MATMRDVARRAGVSAKTVSRVFNHDPHVSVVTKERVETALRELNYVPSTLSTTFRSGRAPVIGVAVPDIADPFFGALAKAVEAVAAVHGMSVVMTSLGEDPTREPAIVQSLLRQSLSGLVIAPIAGDQSYLDAWVARTRLVFVDRRASGIVADSFTEDDHAGAQLATRHLVEHGHVRIGFLGDSTAIPTSRGRLVGYRAALLDAAIDYDESLVVLGALDRRSAAAAFAALERLEEPPTAIFASNARVTMSLVPVLRGHGHLALAGFGDFPMADMLDPSVTVIDQDPAALGTLAAQRILDRLAHPRRRYRRHTVLPVELVERASCLSTG